MGLGVVLLAPDGERREHSALAPGHGCNNESELHALCLAIELAVAAGARRLILRGDSDLAVRYVTGVDSTAVARLLPLIARARVGLARFDDARLLWLPRHRNADADRLSRQALGLAAGVTPKPARRRRR
ncbi:MAG: ribonuclease HI family protein [Sulfuritalea sp.]|nr:ribonuclease HI family protein [Sulfuritalea sp.]